ncbi:MAG: Gfo/Idh/MocA family oxidoreductase [Phaeodactylibacter sp.]|nr:Gfo/Idh/MocA family oxidoreductase [Phaeodactylibacter sp.]
MPSTNRRDFIKTAAAGAAAVTLGPISLTAKHYRRIPGANERVRIAIQGCYRRFDGLLPSFKQLDNTDIVYVCDVDAKRQDRAVAAVREATGQDAKAEKDFRKILQQDDVDAVFLATPDHWHAPAAWMALDAGKHIYIEKPCSHNPREGELLIAFQEKYGKVVQMGAQQRSAPESREIIAEIHNGAIGEPYLATAYYSNGRGKVEDAHQVPPPEWLDWELWQGPAPRRPFVDILADYNWHWFWHWGTGETGNNATHELDIARWALQVTYPELVYVDAGKYHFKDDPWVMYDTMLATFKFPGGKTIQWDGKSRNPYLTYGGGRGTIIYGTEGSVHVNREGYQLFGRSGELVRENFSGGKEAGTALGGGGDMTTLHVKNFLDAIRGEATLHAPIGEGAISTHLCHYANISSRMGNARLEVDPETGRFKDQRAMEEYWSREYEKGWEPPSI